MAQFSALALSNERYTAVGAIIAAAHEAQISIPAFSRFRRFDSSPDVVRLVVLVYVPVPVIAGQRGGPAVRARDRYRHMYVKRAVDHKGDVLESLVTKNTRKSDADLHERGAESAMARLTQSPLTALRSYRVAH